MKKISLLTIAGLIAFSANSFAGSISGLIKYEGDVPKLKEIKMDADPICSTHHTGAVLSQVLLLGEGQSLGNVFVRIVNGLPKKDYPAPTEVISIDQRGCMYDPHVVGIMKGQTAKILNPDGTLHNVHALSKINPEFNLAMPKFRTEVTKSWDKEEFMFGLKCDVHPWMGAWVSVMSHPFFGTTKADGIFKIDNLPAGTYDIEAWHEKLGVQKASITIAEGESKEQNFTFAKPAAK